MRFRVLRKLYFGSIQQDILNVLSEQKKMIFKNRIIE